MSDRKRPTVAIAGTLLGIYWVGFAFAHAELLRQLPHGNGVFLDVLVGTFLGDTGAYAGGRLFGRHPLRPDLPQQDGRGAVLRDALAIIAVFLAGPLPDVADPGPRAAARRGGGRPCAARRPVRVAGQARCRRQGRGQLFGPHGGALDRLDGALFTVVVGYYIWLAVALTGRRGERAPRLAIVPRRLAILGSTGSIGVQALDVVSRVGGELDGRRAQRRPAPGSR